MIARKIFEYVEDLERFCKNKRWGKFYQDYLGGDLEDYGTIMNNCYDDPNEEKDAAKDLWYEIEEYLDLLWNETNPDTVLCLDEEKQNAREWLDKTVKYIRANVQSLRGNDLKGFLVKCYQMEHLIKEAAHKTDKEFYGERIPASPYAVVRESSLFNKITENTIKTPFGKMQVVDEFVIQDDDKVTFCQKAREKYNELDKDGWFDSRSNEPYWYAFPYNRAKFTLCVSKSLGKVCFIDYRKEGKDNLFEARVFSHSSGFGLSGRYDYEAPKKEPFYIATETNEDDGELYFDEKGNTTEFETDAKRFTSEKDALEFAKSNVIFGEPGTKLLESHKLNEDGLFKPFAGMALTMAALTAIGVQNKNFDEKCKAIADELGVKLGKNAFDQRGSAYYMPYLQSFKYDGGSKDYGMTPDGLCKYIRKTANVDNVEYKTVDGGVEILFVDRYSVNIGNVIHRREARGSFFVPNSYFEVSFIFNESYNKSQLFDRILKESSLKENECSLEQLLSKAFVSEYRMVSENSAIVRVRTSPALLTSDSMAARFEEDIPDGYELEVEYLGEDPVLGRNLDIYEVQLLKN